MDPIKGEFKGDLTTGQSFDPSNGCVDRNQEKRIGWNESDKVIFWKPPQNLGSTKRIG